jgi:hypothetical protein
MKILDLNSSVPLQTLRLLAFLVSILNIKVLKSKYLKDQLYKYILSISIADAIATSSLFISGFLAGANVHQDPLKKNPIVYVAFVVTYIAFSEYLTSSLAVYTIIMEIFLTIQRFLVIHGKSSYFDKLKPKAVCAVILLLGLVVYIPVLFTRQISITESMELLNDNMTIFLKRNIYVNKTSFSSSRFFISYASALTSMRVFLVTVVLLALNIALILKLKIYLNLVVSKTGNFSVQT